VRSILQLRGAEALVAVVQGCQFWHGVVVEDHQGGWATGESASGSFHAATQGGVAAAARGVLHCLPWRPLLPGGGQRARADVAGRTCASWRHSWL
jgi:hypothetical protein